MHNSSMPYPTGARKFSSTALAAILMIVGCAPPARPAACGMIESFSQEVGSSGTTYADLAVLASMLSADLYATAGQAGRAASEDQIRYAAGAAQDLSTVIRGGWGQDTIQLEMDILADALQDVLASQC